ncbi:hypothetical protein D3C80_1973620 [compost metagenome]
MRAQLFFVDLGTGLAHHHRVHRFAPLLVRNANHRTHGHLGMAGDDVLDLGGIHVLAAADDHVLEAVDNEQVALLVHVGAVAGEQPTVT